MSFIQTLIERKLSGAMNATTTLGSFSFNPITGSLEGAGMKVAGERFAVPILTVEKISAKLSVKRALKQEIVFTSLSIEKPVFSVMVRSDGVSNLSRSAAKSSGAPEKGGTWEFECDRIDVTDASVHFRHFGHENYQLAVEGLTGALASEGNDVRIDFSADTCGRRDKPVELGPLHLSGRLIGAGRFSNIGGAALDLSATVSSLSTLISAKIASTLLENLAFDVSLSLAMKLSTLMSLPPDNVRIPITLEGDKPVELKLQTSLRDRHIRIENIDLRAGAISVGRRKH